MTCILSVDDCFENLVLFDFVFKLNGYVNLFTTDSCEAWVILHKKPIDLLIIDLRLPHFDGWKICEMMEIDEVLSQIPVILLSARGCCEHELSPPPRIVKDYLFKPIDIFELPTRIARVLKKHGKPLPTPAEVEYWKNFPKRLIEERLAALQDLDPFTRRSAIWDLVLAQNTPEVVQAVRERLEDEDFLVSLAAVQVLKHYRDNQAIGPLQKLVNRVPSERLKDYQELPIPQWDADINLAWHAKWAIEHIKIASKRH
jgi:CheY-like chemotaxis protein